MSDRLLIGIAYVVGAFLGIIVGIDIMIQAQEAGAKIADVGQAFRWILSKKEASQGG